jgi:hypothetical protein
MHKSTTAAVRQMLREGRWFVHWDQDCMAKGYLVLLSRSLLESVSPCCPSSPWGSQVQHCPKLMRAKLHQKLDSTRFQTSRYAHVHHNDRMSNHYCERWNDFDNKKKLCCLMSGSAPPFGLIGGDLAMRSSYLITNRSKGASPNCPCPLTPYRNVNEGHSMS